MKHTPLYTYARTIAHDWQKVNYAAMPYLEAMRSLDQITDAYYLDSGSRIVAGFIAAAGSWRGETARRVKAELRTILEAAA